MRNEPLVSVIMGVFNCEGTLPEAVACLTGQTYKNWELIMCDDASTDATYKVAEELAKTDARIRVIRNEKNLTLAPTLNRCLREAKGVYIARMDGDDLCAEDRLKKEVAFLEEHPQYALVSCQMSLFDREGTYRTVSHMEEPAGRDLLYRSQFCHAGCLIRKDVMLALGGYSEDRTSQRVEDYDLWVRLYSAGYRGFNLQETLYFMRDDRNAVQRRSLKNRIHEAGVKYRVCRAFALPIWCYGFIVIPVMKWFVPPVLYRVAHRRKDSE